MLEQYDMRTRYIKKRPSSYKSITPELISQVFVTMTKMKINMHKKSITV